MKTTRPASPRAYNRRMERMEQTTKPMNRSVARTLAALSDAYAQLLMDKPIDKITVTDVARRANVSRMTFYSYFSSIDDLRRSYFTRARRMVEAIHMRGVVFDMADTDDLVAAIVDFLYASHDEYGAFIARYRDSPNARVILMSTVRDVYEMLLADVVSSGRIVTERDKRCLSFTLLIAFTLMYQYDTNDLDVPREAMRDAYQEMVRDYSGLLSASRVAPKGLDPTAMLMGELWPAIDVHAPEASPR